MAIYHLNLQVIRRSAGRSVVAAAAYRTGTCLFDLRDGVMHDYTRKAVAEAFTLTPAGVDWALDRETFWNAVEVAERRRKSTLAREWEVALPAELDPGARVALVRRFAQDLVDRYTVVADVGVHGPEPGGDARNWHAHVLIPTRMVTPEGMGKKTRVLDDIATGPKEVEAVRALWAARANEALREHGFSGQLDHRSFKRQGREQLPTEHLGPTAAALERKALREQGISVPAGLGISAAIALPGFQPVTDRGRLIIVSRLLDRFRELVGIRQRTTDRMLELGRQRERGRSLER